MSEPRYSINLFWSVEDRCWIAEVPDLKPCSAHGETAAEAAANVADAIALWLEVARDRGIAIPEPHYHPASYAAG